MACAPNADSARQTHRPQGSCSRIQIICSVRAHSEVCTAPERCHPAASPVVPVSLARCSCGGGACSGWRPPRPETLAGPRDRACHSRSRVYGCWRGPRLVGTSSGVPVANAPPTATPTAAASPSASSTGRQLTASQLLPGDCLTGSNLQLNKSGQWTTLVQAVPCDQEHTAEVYYSSNYWAAD